MLYLVNARSRGCDQGWQLFWSSLHRHPDCHLFERMHYLADRCLVELNDDNEHQSRNFELGFMQVLSLYPCQVLWCVSSLPCGSNANQVLRSREVFKCLIMFDCQSPNPRPSIWAVFRPAGAFTSMEGYAPFIERSSCCISAVVRQSWSTRDFLNLCCGEDANETWTNHAPRASRQDPYTAFSTKGALFYA